jgi:hypothetical protein
MTFTTKSIGAPESGGESPLDRFAIARGHQQRRSCDGPALAVD